MIPTLRAGLLLLPLLALSGATPARAGDPAAPVRVDSFSPTGEAKAVRQVTARFSRPVVTFGDPRTEPPFDIDCAPRGHGHWVDPRNWAYDFDRDLPAGISCKFMIKPGAKAFDGTAIAPGEFAFNTGGPAILRSWPREGDERIDEQQAFLLSLDAPTDLESIGGNAWCEFEGVGERIPLEVIQGGERTQILDQQRDRARSFFLALTKRGEAGIIAVKDPRAADDRIIVAHCARPLPPGAAVTLAWGPGIKTKTGLARTDVQTLAFQARPRFEAKVGCERVNARAACIPVLPVTVDLTAPIARTLAAKLELSGGGHSWEPTLPSGDDLVESLSFNGPFPAGKTLQLKLPSGLVDDAGRALSNAGSFPVAIEVGDDPPLLKFPSDFGILEAGADPALPVTVRNIEATLKGQHAAMPAGASKGASGHMVKVADQDPVLIDWLHRVLAGPERPDSDAADENDPELAFQRRPGALPLLTGDLAESATPLELPSSGGIKSGGKAFEVIGIPLPDKGFHIVEFASQRLGEALHGDGGKGRPYYVYSSALVTNLAVHFKLGRESSLAWVTRLDNSAPVAGAQVQVSDCHGKALWHGATDGDGLASIQATLTASHDSTCGPLSSALFVSARHDGDTSFMLSTWNDGIRPWNFNLGGGEATAPLIAHTVTDRALFRAGETVSMKHLVRQRSDAGFAPLTGALPARIQIVHEGTGTVFDVPVRWGAGSTGNGDSTWKIPKDARLGEYTIKMRLGRYEVIESGDFRVEEYRVPLMHAELQVQHAPLVAVDGVDIDAQLSYLSGGPAAGLPVKLRSRLEPYQPTFRDYDGFHFDANEPKEGVQAAEQPDDASADSSDDADEEGAPAGDESTPAPSVTAARVQALTLDRDGGGRFHVDHLPPSPAPRALQIEMEYADPNGRILDAATSAVLLPSKLVLGTKLEGFYATRDRLAFKVVALDPNGKPQAGRQVDVDAYLRVRHAVRKRLLGGFYAYDQSVEIHRIGSACGGRTDARGLLVCDGAAPASGELVLVARGADDEGHRAVATLEADVAGDDPWFEAGASDRIDMLSDRPAYEPGDVARFEVRMPFREATALVTVEREGVVDAKVVTLSAKQPYIDLPIKANYGPNAYVSALVVRGRIDPEQPGRFAWLHRMIYRIARWAGLSMAAPRDVDTRPTAMVDLTRPAFRLALAEIRVGWRDYQLDVAVDAERPVYRVREHAAVTVTVKDPSGAPAADADVILAAVDEGLLQLAPNTSWNLLESMMRRRPLEVTTSTAQAQVIGKRHFGKKAAAPGGGGGSSPGSPRELFDSLLLWQGHVVLDAQGKARIDVPLNDSLTSFRIVAVASQGVARFGEGHASIRASQDLMLFAGLPPQVREGDHFAAMVTVRNASDHPLEADVRAQMQVPSPTAAPVPPAASQHVALDPGAAKTLTFAGVAPVGVEELRWTFNADSGAAHDALKTTQRVSAAVPVQVLQQTLEQIDPAQPLEMPVELPAGAVRGRGSIDIRLARSLVGDLGAVRDWMQRYPYTCLEQRASVAIATEDAAAWQRVMGALPAFLDRDGLAKYFASPMLQGDDTLTAYLLSIAAEAGLEIPETPRDAMLRGLDGFVAGRINRYGHLPTADLAIRKLAAIEALAHYGAAKPEMLQSIEIAPELWPSSALIDWISILQQVDQIPNRDARLDAARKLLRARLTFSGTTLTFSTEQADALWWLMVSPDRNAVRALLLLAHDEAFHDDLPRMARGAITRQQHGHWSTTIANAWGVLALRRFAAGFEKDPVGGSTRARLGTDEQKLDWARARPAAAATAGPGPADPGGLEAHFAWPAQASTLSVSHAGSGKPWAFIAARAALPLVQPLFAGYQVKREVSVVERKDPTRWTRGDVFRVTLEIDAQTDMTWVVVADPVPAGATILGSGLGGDSAGLTRDERRRGWTEPAFEERSFEAYRAYFDYLPKGKVMLQYTARFDNPGTFELPGTRVEAMYAPELFGELPAGRIEVVDQ